MNCKQGDLAIIVDAPNDDPLGKVVQCVELAGQESANCRHKGSPLWLVSSVRPIKLKEFGARKEFLAPDSALRPIRDAEGEDEMLRIAGKPNKKKEKV